jgi:hypothetical protein
VLRRDSRSLGAGVHRLGHRAIGIIRETYYVFAAKVDDNGSKLPRDGMTHTILLLLRKFDCDGVCWRRAAGWRFGVIEAHEQPLLGGSVGEVHERLAMRLSRGRRTRRDFGFGIADCGLRIGDCGGRDEGCAAAVAAT